MQQVKPFVNYYEILGLPNTATIHDIKKAHHTLALKYHPDKNPTKAARDKFHEIQSAYEILKDSSKKKSYDNILAAKLEDLRRYELQDKLKQKLATDLLKREEENVNSQIKKQQQMHRDKYEAKIARMKQIEELLVESSKQKVKNAAKHFTVLIKWKHKSKVSYTKENLKLIFSQYGRIDDTLIINEKHRAYIMFAYKDSAAKVVEEKEKFAGEFKIKAVKEVEHKTDELQSNGFLSTDVLNRIRLANEKRSYDIIKEQMDEVNSSKKKKVEEPLDSIDPEEFKKKEEEILRKLIEE